MFKRRPPCIKKWYSSVVTYDHPDLIQIPIGFGVFFHEWPQVNEEYQSWMFDNSERLCNTEKNLDTVYCNYTIDHFRPPRHNVSKELTENGVKCYFPPDKKTINGRLTFPEYCETMAQYKFVASPPGNGIDCHRNWEAIYLGCIPIVIDNLVYRDYDLPMIKVKSYKEITPEFLENYLNYYNFHQYNYDHASLSYWEKRMRNDLID
jgi:hypothetical protein